MSNTKTSRIGSAIAFVLSGVFITLAVLLFFNRQAVLDQLSVWSYTPSSEIEALSKRVAFTDKGQFIFYATKPSVDSPETFNSNCPRQEKGSPILGCYTTDDRIYIYDLTNEKLDGMEEVTAAHEMLHAVWGRASGAEKERLTAELRAAYSGIDDEDLKARMDYYERTEPGEFINELHSILGTEVASLSPSLEAYYGQFYDRATVLELHKQYSSVYKALYDRADQLYQQMESLAASIEVRSDTYDSTAGQLSADIESFNRRADSGEFTTQAQFNRERNTLVQRSASLEAERVAINNDIQQYNTYYAEYEELSKQIDTLNDSMDSFKQIDQGPSV